MKKDTLKSIGAVFSGFLVVIVLTILTDLALEKTNTIKQPFDLNPWWFIGLVVLYRCFFATLGSYITARLAPIRPLRLAMIGGSIGLIVSIVGAIVMWHQPPHWYPIALIITALPCAWLGGKIFVNSLKS